MNKEFVYNGQVVEFFHSDQLMLNATEMGAIFKKRPVDFLSLESTKKWIKWLENNNIRPYRSEDSSQRSAGKGVFPGEIKHRSGDLVPILTIERGGDGGGSTWMHHLLAIDFAMWLDIDFKGWCVLKIHMMLTSYGSRKSQLQLEKYQLEAELAEIIRTEGEGNIAVKRIGEIRKDLDYNKGEMLNLNKDFKRNLFNQ